MPNATSKPIYKGLSYNELVKIYKHRQGIRFNLSDHLMIILDKIRKIDNNDGVILDMVESKPIAMKADGYVMIQLTSVKKVRKLIKELSAFLEAHNMHTKEGEINGETTYTRARLWRDWFRKKYIRRDIP